MMCFRFTRTTLCLNKAINGFERDNRMLRLKYFFVRNCSIQIKQKFPKLENEGRKKVMSKVSVEPEIEQS